MYGPVFMIEQLHTIERMFTRVSFVSLAELRISIGIPGCSNSPLLMNERTTIINSFPPVIFLMGFLWAM